MCTGPSSVFRGALPVLILLDRSAGGSLDDESVTPGILDNALRFIPYPDFQV